ncbi:MAG: ComEA family DNA-binding protein [Nitrospirota bacterium]
MELFKSFNRTQQKVVLFLIASALTASAILIVTHLQREKALSKIEVVHSAFEVFSEEVVPEKVNINTAFLEELIELPKIGLQTAKRIIEYRKTYGKFRAIEEITKVKGIGQKTLEKIKGEITVGTISSLVGQASSLSSSNLLSKSNTFNEGKTFDKKVNLNTASLKEIESLPKIGPVIAKKIIEYRNANGGFKSIEEIMEVRGIGEKTYEKIRELITVEDK